MKYTFTINGKTITIDSKILEELANLIGNINKTEDIKRKLEELEMYFEITKNLDQQLLRVYNIVKGDEKLMKLLALLVKLLEMEKEFREHGINNTDAEKYNKIRDKFKELIDNLSKGSESSAGVW